MIEIISRLEAIKSGLLHFFTGKPCKYNHICKRYTKNRKCVDCDKEHTKRYANSRNAKRRDRTLNDPIFREKHKKGEAERRRKIGPDKMREISLSQYYKNPKKNNINRLKNRILNREFLAINDPDKFEKLKEKEREKSKRYREKKRNSIIKDSQDDEAVPEVLKK